MRSLPMRSLPIGPPFRHAMRALLAGLAACLALAGPAGAIEFRAGPEDPGAVLEGFELHAEVQGRYVAVTVNATITGPALAVGELRFPLPPGAVLYEAAVWVPEDERWAVAETLGRRQGARVFSETPSEATTSPLLVQQIGRDFYRAKVHAPEEVDRLELRIRYAHLIERTAEGGYALRFALANPDLGRGRPAALALHVDAPAGWRVVGWRGPGLARVDEAGGSLIDPAHALDSDVFVDVEPLDPPGPAGGLVYLPAPAPEDAPADVQARFAPHTHLHYAPDLSELPVAPRRLVFVLDRSGSMNGAKMREARRGVIRVLERLGADDRFDVVAFDDANEVFAGALVGIDRRDAAIAFVEAIDARNGTDIHQALVAAADVAGEQADLILITDGLPTAGQANPVAALRELDAPARGLRIFSFGIGQSVDQGYLNALALGSGGDVAYALDDGEIAGDLFDLVDRAVTGGATDGALVADEARFEVGRVLPGDELYLGLVGPPPEALRLEAVSAGGPIVFEEALGGLPAGAEGLHRIAAPLSAKARADRLERIIDREGETDERVDAAVALAQAYGIVTRYSSLLALVREADYAERGVERIARDPAGLALTSVSGAEEDEGRIGGAGADPAPGDADGDGDGVADAWDNDEVQPAPPRGAAADGGLPAANPPGPDADEGMVGCAAGPGHDPALPLVGALLLLALGLGGRRG